MGRFFFILEIKILFQNFDVRFDTKIKLKLHVYFSLDNISKTGKKNRQELQ